MVKVENCARCNTYQGGDLPEELYARTVAAASDDLHRASHRFRDDLLDALPKWYTRHLGWKP